MTGLLPRWSGSSVVGEAAADDQVAARDLVRSGRAQEDDRAGDVVRSLESVEQESRTIFLLDVRDRDATAGGPRLPPPRPPVRVGKTRPAAVYVHPPRGSLAPRPGLT